eukprot:3513959-Amphidinium_carterae.1
MKVRAAEESLIHSSMCDHVQRIMRPKRLKVLEWMMEHTFGVDHDLLSFLHQGFPLSGRVPATSMFEQRSEPYLASLSKTDLLSDSVRRRASMISTVRLAADPMHDDMLLSATMDEVDKGWAEGPLTEDQLNKRYGVSGWISARRFGIGQSSMGRSKFRVIDDYTCSGQNATTHVDEKLNHGGLDEVIGVARVLTAGLNSDAISFVDTSGRCWSSPVHHSWSGCKLVGRCLDLKSAYKQLP